MRDHADSRGPFTNPIPHPVGWSCIVRGPRRPGSMRLSWLRARQESPMGSSHPAKRGSKARYTILSGDRLPCFAGAVPPIAAQALVPEGTRAAMRRPSRRARRGQSYSGIGSPIGRPADGLFLP